MARISADPRGDAWNEALLSLGQNVSKIIMGNAQENKQQEANAELADVIGQAQQQPGGFNPFENEQSMLSFLSQTGHLKSMLNNGTLNQALQLVGSKPRAAIAPPSAKDYTSESMRVYLTTGDASQLIPIEKPEKPETTSAMTEAQALGYSPGSPEYKDYLLKRAFPEPAERDKFVGAPFADAEGNYVIRNREGHIFRVTPVGDPVPYGSGISSAPLAAVPGATPYGAAAGGIKAPVTPLTEAEAKNVGYEGRMQLGDEGIDQFLDANPDYLASWSAKIDQVSRQLGESGKYILGGLGGAIGGVLGGVITKTPMGVAAGTSVGAGVGGAAGEALGAIAEQFITSDPGKEYIAKATPFVTSALRKDTGAAITSQEWTNAFREWLPLPGDPPSVVNAKARNREAAMRGATVGAGKGAGRAVAPKTTLKDLWDQF